MSKNRFDKHHRRPRSRGGRNNARNISYIPRDAHEHWHSLFKNWMPEQIAERINDWFLDPDYVMVAVRKKE